MDKQILKVKSDVSKGNKKKAQKDLGKLLKMDKKQDRKVEKCKKMSTKVKHHLKGDIKTFKKEAQEDKKLIKKMK